MASILTGHVTHWACLGGSGSAYTTACSSSWQYPATSHSHWRGVDQHSTGHNQQPDQLYVKEMCCTGWGKWWSHPILTGFRTPDPPNTVKLHILEWSFFIVASLRATYAIIMLSNQHLNMPYMWSGWIISQNLILPSASCSWVNIFVDPGTTLLLTNQIWRTSLYFLWSLGL